jgi:hypothetical protein
LLPILEQELLSSNKVLTVPFCQTAPKSIDYEKGKQCLGQHGNFDSFNLND